MRKFNDASISRTSRVSSRTTDKFPVLSGDRLLRVLERLREIRDSFETDAYCLLKTWYLKGCKVSMQATCVSACPAEYNSLTRQIGRGDACMGALQRPGFPNNGIGNLQNCTGGRAMRCIGSFVVLVLTLSQAEALDRDKYREILEGVTEALESLRDPESDPVFLDTE